MRNKKGFTLIELLAIIVILAIIAVITVPIILNIIDNAEKGSVEDSALGYKDALQKYYATKSVQNPEQELPSGYIEISELPSDFTVSGENPSDGWVKLKNGIVEKYSLKYKDYVVSMDNDKNVVSEKKEKIEPHVTNDYQEVEYLESTGTQYIDTEAKIFKNNNHEIVISFEPTSFYNYVTLWGTNYDADTFEAWIYSTGNIAGRYNLIRYGNDTLLNLNEKYTAKFIKKNSNLSFYLNDELKQSNVPTVNNKSVDSSLYLFKSGQDYGKYKLYFLKLYSDDALVRNFVPVIRKSDNKPGLLDLANISKNLFSSEWEQGSIDSNSGANVNVSNSIRTKNYISVIPNKHYAINRSVTSSYMNIRGYDINKNYVGYGASVVDLIQGNTASNPMHSKNDSCVIAPKENVYYLKFNDTSNDLNTHYMMVEGDTQAEYEPYKDVFYTNAGEGEFVSGPEL